MDANPAIQNTKTFYINYFDAIDLARVKILMGVCTEIMQKHRPEELYFLFSSPGGEVMSGITLYNFLRSLPVKVIMRNAGSIDSIATAIFLAGEERYASPSSSFLFHGVAAGFGQNTTMSATQLQERLSGVKEDENKIARIITERSKLDDATIRKLFREGEAKDPNFAKKFGIINDVCDFRIPKDSPIVSININTN